MVKSNLRSKANLSEPCDLSDLNAWFDAEIDKLKRPKVKKVVQTVSENLNEFIEFPEESILLWHGCDREGSKYHRYPDSIKVRAKKNDLNLDGRSNGPAIFSFQLAGGTRPDRWGSSNSWSTHHLYSGKYPYVAQEDTLHAVKSGKHFTQSAGLVAVHPIADAMCDEFPSFAWYLRAKAFLRFGYDPDSVFSSRVDEFGFKAGQECSIIYSDV